jgi:hypothetical protein
MIRRGYSLITAYQDDFFIAGETYDECLEAWVALIQLLMSLGFNINYKKLVSPSTDIVFLGVRINSETMQLSLPPDKLRQIKEVVTSFKHKQRATRRQLQSLAGKLNHAARVVRGGRTFLRRLLSAITKLRSPHHKTRVQGALKHDIDWWNQYMEHFNGVAAFISAESASTIMTDACPRAGGAFFNGDFYYVTWSADQPAMLNAPINYKEAMMGALSVIHWAPMLRNRVVYLYTDNMCALSIINKCASRNVVLMDTLRSMFWCSVKYNFVVKAIYMPGHKHLIADTISRLHEPCQIRRLEQLVNDWFMCHCNYNNAFSYVSMCNHMSMSTLCSIFDQVSEWRQRSMNWTSWW